MRHETAAAFVGLCVMIGFFSLIGWALYSLNSAIEQDEAEHRAFCESKGLIAGQYRWNYCEDPDSLAIYSVETIEEAEVWGVDWRTHRRHGGAK